MYNAAAALTATERKISNVIYFILELGKMPGLVLTRRFYSPR
jgi:hypothetical protein